MVVGISLLLVPLIDKVYHNFNHHILLLCLALSNHQGQGNEGVVCKSLGAVLAIEDMVVVEEPPPLTR